MPPRSSVFVTLSFRQLVKAEFVRNLDVGRKGHFVREWVEWETEMPVDETVYKGGECVPLGESRAGSFGGKKPNRAEDFRPRREFPPFPRTFPR